MTRASLFRRDLPDGRLHLQEGPIDLVVEAFGKPAEVRIQAEPTSKTLIIKTITASGL